MPIKYVIVDPQQSGVRRRIITNKKGMSELEEYLHSVKQLGHVRTLIDASKELAI